MDTSHLRRIYKTLQKHLYDPHEQYLVVSTERQTLLVCSNDTIVERYMCSTSRFGNGNRENSLKTPVGLHRIREKFGAGLRPAACSGTVRTQANTGTTGRTGTISS